MFYVNIVPKVVKIVANTRRINTYFCTVEIKMNF